jgi:hypothetical protein
MAESKTRRSFIVELLSTAAGTWVAVGGLFGAATAASGCGNDSAKYGGRTVDGPVVKYGGPQDGGLDIAVKYGGPPDKGIDGMVTKYGGPPDGGKKDLGPVVKYGGWDMSIDGFTTKYGGLKLDGMAMKYGGPNQG